MADAELISITEDSTPDPTDFLYLVDSTGTTDKRSELRDAVAATAPSVPGCILDTASFTPGSDIQTSGTSFADVDATNAIVTFTAPLTTNVIITASANAEVVVNVSLYWGLRDAGGNVAGTESKVLFSGSGAATIDGRPCYEVLLTGLTAGNSYSYKLAHRVSTGSSGFVLSGSPVVMKAIVAP